MKKIKILFWKLLLWYTDINIKVAYSDLKIFEKREIKFEGKLRKLIGNELFSEEEIKEMSKGFSGGHTIKDPKEFINKRFGFRGRGKSNLFGYPIDIKEDDKDE